MPTPPLASAAKAASDTDKTALTDAANTQFITDAITAIVNANSLGQYQVFLTAAPAVDYNYIAHYFQGLGYGVTFPDFPSSSQAQPAQLFGESWIDFWTGQVIPTFITPGQPVRIGFSWQAPTA